MVQINLEDVAVQIEVDSAINATPILHSNSGQNNPHSTLITDIALSRDGAWITSCSRNDNAIALWSRNSDNHLSLVADSVVPEALERIGHSTKGMVMVVSNCGLNSKPNPFVVWWENFTNQEGLWVGQHRVFDGALKKVKVNCLESVKDWCTISAEGRKEKDEHVLVVAEETRILVVSTEHWPWTILRIFDNMKPWHKHFKRPVVVAGDVVTFASNIEDLYSSAFHRRSLRTGALLGTFRVNQYVQALRVVLSSTGNLMAVINPLNGYLETYSLGTDMQVCETEKDTSSWVNGDVLFCGFVHKDRRLLFVKKVEHPRKEDHWTLVASLLDAVTYDVVQRVWWPNNQNLKDRVCQIIAMDDGHLLLTFSTPQHSIESIEWNWNAFALSEIYDDVSKIDTVLDLCDGISCLVGGAFHTIYFKYMKSGGISNGNEKVERYRHPHGNITRLGKYRFIHTCLDKRSINVFTLLPVCTWPPLNECHMVWLAPTAPDGTNLTIVELNLYEARICAGPDDHNCDDIQANNNNCDNQIDHDSALWLLVTLDNGDQHHIWLPPAPKNDTPHSWTPEWMQSFTDWLPTLDPEDYKPSEEIASVIQHLRVLPDLSRLFNTTTTLVDLCYQLEPLFADGVLPGPNYRPSLPPSSCNPLRAAINSGHARSVQQLLDHYLKIFYQDPNNNLSIMSFVVDALPSLASTYPDIFTKLMHQCTYISCPDNGKRFTRDDIIRFQSTHEELWPSCYDAYLCYPDIKRSGLLTRFMKNVGNIINHYEAVPSHWTRLCIVPLFGLCTYEDYDPLNLLASISNTLVPRHLSVFAQLAFGSSSSEVFSTPLFEAIVKFKWHKFARWRFFTLFFLDFLHFAVFVSAVITKGSTRRWLMLISIILGSLLVVSWLRRLAVHGSHGKRYFFSFTSYLDLVAAALPLTAGWMTFSKSGPPPSPQLLSVAAFSVWLSFTSKFRVFEGMGIFISVISQVIRRIGWFLVLLVLMIFAFAHSLMILLTTTAESDTQLNSFQNLGTALKSVWSFLLGDYKTIEDIDNNILLDIFKIAFSFGTTIILLNILIALLNSKYEDAYSKGRMAWIHKRAEMIAEIEVCWMTPSERRNRDLFPFTICYEAHEEKFKEWPIKLMADNIPMPWHDDPKSVTEVPLWAETLKGELKVLKELVFQVLDERNVRDGETSTRED